MTEQFIRDCSSGLSDYQTFAWGSRSTALDGLPLTHNARLTMSVPPADFADALPSGRKSADKASNSSSNRSRHSILPSPPDSPPLRTRVPLPRQDTDGKLLSPEQRERDVEANESYEMGPLVMSRGASTALTPMSTHMSAADSEHDPLLLRSKQLNEEEIELRRRASRRAGKSRWGIAKLGACVCILLISEW